MNSTEKQIRTAMLEKGVKMKELAEFLNTSSPNIIQKLSRGSLKYCEVEEIADYLGYDIIWREKEQSAEK